MKSDGHKMKLLYCWIIELTWEMLRISLKGNLNKDSNDPSESEEVITGTLQEVAGLWSQFEALKMIRTTMWFH